MATTFILDAQNAHPDILEELLGPKLLTLQREATKLLDQSLELAELIWELEVEFLSSQGSLSPASCDYQGTSLTPIAEYDGDDDLERETIFSPPPPYDAAQQNGDDDIEDDGDDIYYQLADMRNEAADLSKRSGKAWSLFCEGVIARLSSSSRLEDAAQPGSQRNPEQPQELWRQSFQEVNCVRLSNYGETREDEERPEACMPATHTDEPAATYYYEDDDAQLEEVDWDHSASPHGDGNASYYDYSDGDEDGDEDVDGDDEPDDYEFRELIRQEYLALAEQHLSSQPHGKRQQMMEAAAAMLSDEFHEQKKRGEDNDDDSGYDEEGDEDEDDEDTLTYEDLLRKHAVPCSEEDSSDVESFKSCLEEFEEDAILE
ncbi:uncharacterized protein PG998_012266 [Apiospora kogelbergensis]|uniref:uncharacterized protein n=1 Tax=Apiospora kogelbergensis TaxID=1337665 RepID=UPI0031307EAD